MIIFRNDLSQSSLVRWLGIKPDAPNSKHVGVHLMVQACALWTLLGCWWWFLCSGDENEMFNVSRRMVRGKSTNTIVSSLANTACLGQSSLCYLGSCIQCDTLGMAGMGGIFVSSSWSRTLLVGCSQCEWSCHFSLGNVFLGGSFMIEAVMINTHTRIFV